MLLKFARIWAYPLWCSVIRSNAADVVGQDVDWWMRCIGDKDLLALDHYSRFAYLSGALTEFRTLVHYPSPLGAVAAASSASQAVPACGDADARSRPYRSRTVHPARRRDDRHRGVHRFALLDQSAGHHRLQRQGQTDAA